MSSTVLFTCLQRHLLRKLPSSTMVAYNPDALYSRLVGGAQSLLPAVALTRMNDPGQAPQRATAVPRPSSSSSSISPASPPVVTTTAWAISALRPPIPNIRRRAINQRPHVPPVNPGTGPTLLANEDSRDRKFRQHYIDRATYDQHVTVQAWAKQLLYQRKARQHNSTLDVEGCNDGTGLVL